MLDFGPSGDLLQDQRDFVQPLNRHVGDVFVDRSKTTSQFVNRLLLLFKLLVLLTQQLAKLIKPSAFVVSFRVNTPRSCTSL